MLHSYLDTLTEQRRDLAGTRDRLAILAEATWLHGSIREPSARGSTCRTVLSGATSSCSGSTPTVVPCDDDGGERDRARPRRHQRAEAERTAPAGVVLIDEFSAVAATAVVKLFGRARGANISLLVLTQEFADLQATNANGSDDARGILEQVVGNLSAIIAHRQMAPRVG